VATKWHCWASQNCMRGPGTASARAAYDTIQIK